VNTQPPDVPAPALPLGVEERTVFRSLFVAYPDSLLLVDRAGLIVLANPSAAALLGYTVEELIGLTVDALVPDAIRPRHAAYREAYGQAPRARPMGTQMELVAKRKDGSEVMVEIALSPLQDHGLPLVVAAIRGIGAYPRVKQALQRARYSEHLAHLGRLAVDARDPQVVLDHAPLIAAEALQAEVARVFLLDSDGATLRVASGVGSVAGEEVGARIPYRIDTVPGLVLAQGEPLIVVDYRRETRFAVPQAYLDAGLTSGLAVPLSDRGRVIGALAVRSRSPQRFSDDEVRFLESLANLIATSLQRAESEEALAHAQRLESVGQLTGGIAHDFNNLLTVIQGNLQVLEELPALADDARAQQLVGAAARASRRGAELTNKLLAFARRQVLQPTAVDTSALLQSLSDMLRRTLDQRIAIDIDAVPTCPRVLADSGQLESALLNIAINARDAMPGGGTLRFRARACEALPTDLRHEFDNPENAARRFVAIAISDTGTGMSDEVKERAFEPFFTTKEAGRGTGLGLSTVYGFVKQSHGAIAIDSVLGSGTTITLYIPQPLEAAAPAENDAGTARPLPESAPRPTITSSAPRGGMSKVAEPHFLMSAPRPTITSSAPRGGMSKVAEPHLLMSLNVLLVEDDAEVAAVVSNFLDTLRCRVTRASSGEQALLMLQRDAGFELLITDIALGAGMRGTELAAAAQAHFPALAVLLMSGYSAELIAADREAPLSWELLRKPCTREELARAMAGAIKLL
jgi:PAS domain S-box-containing protein